MKTLLTNPSEIGSSPALVATGAVAICYVCETMRAQRRFFHATVTTLVARSDMKIILAGLAFASTLTIAHAAWAGCRISNTTKWDFTVESGNTSNQRVGPNTTTTIAAGKIKGVDKKNGKSISGTCKDGDRLEVKDDGGVPVLLLK